LRIESAELFALKIPFVMPPMSHSAYKDRGACDSVVLQLSSAGVLGHGEIVFREYVSGAAGGSEDLVSWAVAITRRLIDRLLDRNIDWREAARDGRDIDPSDLPFVCALETALLDLACRLSGRDAYELLGLAPVRQAVAFSGIIPLYPPAAAARFLLQFARAGVRSFKVKLGSDPAANRAVLSACREAAGKDGDLRVDANGAWRVADAEAQLDACEAAGVSAIEQPFPVDAAGADEAIRLGVQRGFLFIADEGFLWDEDLDAISRAGTYGMLNLRLAKNGGLTRVLRLARTATERGIEYQLGCMAAETGILSALGRLAASLLPAPRWVEGGYDGHLYADHLAGRHFGFDPDGTAPVIRGAGIGYTVRADRLEVLSVGRAKVL
jgi:L-alanine-DL-glutamate epimerase-like enolase superfamily enzyme